MKNKPTPPTQLNESLSEALTRIDADIKSGEYDKNELDPKSVELSKEDKFKLDCLKVGIKPLELPYTFSTLVGIDTQINTCRSSENPLGLYLSGTKGTGKTHLTVCVIKEKIYKHGAFTCKYVKASDLFLEIRATFNSSNAKTEEEIIEYYRNKTYLAIDDIGSGSNSEYERNVLLQILDGRQRNIKWTILTSNMDIESLGKHIGEREASRFKMYENIQFTGKDNRGKLS